MHAYPEAKVILTVRDSPQAWHKSMCNSILPLTALLSPSHIRHPGWNPLNHLCRLLKPSMPGHSSCQPFMDRLCDYLLKDELWDPAVASNAYCTHNQHIRDLVSGQHREEQFLEFNAKQGWGPLCTFLGKPIPDIPFPNVNDSATQQALTRSLRWKFAVGYVANAFKLFGPVVLALSALWWLEGRQGTNPVTFARKRLFGHRSH